MFKLDPVIGEKYTDNTTGAQWIYASKAGWRRIEVPEVTDLKEEIQCRIDYYKQLCRDRQFIDQETWHFYRGSVSALTTLLSYMERGTTNDL
jgi:hypothetical protein